MFGKHKCDMPASSDYHPELDDTPFLSPEDINLYQSYLGTLHWLVKLGRVDNAHFASIIAQFSAAPRDGHLVSLLRCFANLKKHWNSKIVFDYKSRIWSNLQLINMDQDWGKIIQIPLKNQC